VLGYAAALPVSAAAAAVAAALLLTGTRVRAAGGVLEVSGGLLRPLLLRTLPGFPIAAVTLGHVVFAADAGSLAASRMHERVHVAQYERWGFLFPLLYLAAGARAVLAGGHAYRDNVFEREAGRRAGQDAAA
jgi:hypothetical protein